MLDDLESDGVALLRQFADSLRADALAMGIAGGGVAFKPGRHGWTGRHGLPAPAESARAGWTGGGDNLMAQFGVSALGPTEKIAVTKDASAGPVAHRHRKQA